MPRDLTTMGKWTPASLVVLGVVTMVCAAGISRIAPGHATAPAPHPGIVLRGPGDVAVVTQVYEPGQTSGGTPTPASTPSPC